MNQRNNNFTTLLIPGGNGTQSQMIKVIGGGAKIPVQLATGTTIPTVKRVFKTADQGAVIQDGKLQGRQIITVPAKPTISIPGIRYEKSETNQYVMSISNPSVKGGPLVVPVSNVQIKQQPTVCESIVVSNNVQNVQPVSDIQLASSTVCASPPKSLMNTSILDHSGVRKRHDFEFDYSIENKRRKSEKGGKGLRHFSMKVCEKVKAKGTTSYNEVADELVHEFTENRSPSLTETASYDQKNIRRRVYDALNVLMAMNIISKEKKEIKWLGLPTNSAQECSKLEQERKKVMQRIKLKTQQLQDLILQQIAFKNLVERNRKKEKEIGEPQWTASLQLPFIIVNTDQDTTIDCSISNEKEEYLFNFDNTFEIHDDIEVLKRMGMSLGLEKGKCSSENIELAKKMVPKILEDYIVELANASPVKEPVKNDTISSLEIDENSSDLALNIKEEHIVQMPLSRHSSRSSLSHGIRSRSPSSFGDFDDSDMEM